MSDAQLERAFQAKLIKRLKQLYPDCVVLKNDSGYQQGIPDLSVFVGARYAFLEVKPRKPTSSSDFEPNQEWFITRFNEMAFAAVIYPENEEEVLEALQHALP